MDSLFSHPFIATLVGTKFRAGDSISDGRSQSKFDSAIIVFPDRTVGSRRLTELWLSLSSQHCHATLNARRVNKKTQPIFASATNQTRSFPENRPGSLPRQSVIYFPADLTATYGSHWINSIAIRCNNNDGTRVKACWEKLCYLRFIEPDLWRPSSKFWMIWLAQDSSKSSRIWSVRVLEKLEIAIWACEKYRMTGTAKSLRRINVTF